MIKWGAEIPCNGRPDWLKDDDVCAILHLGHWCTDSNYGRVANEWAWDNVVTAIMLPANHPRYWNTDIATAIATLEAAGYTVTAPDPYAALLDALLCANTMIDTLRRAIPNPASIDMTVLAKGE
jgi:hypothetical protein